MDGGNSCSLTGLFIRDTGRMISLSGLVDWSGLTVIIMRGCARTSRLMGKALLLTLKANIYIRETGLRIGSRDRGKRLWRGIISIKGSLKMVFFMEVGKLFLMMEHYIMGTFWKVKLQDRDLLIILLENSIWALFRMVKNMAGEYLYGVMEENMKVIIRMIFLMDKGYFFGLMGTCLMANGKMDYRMVRE
jgi:hypothetical protein